MGFDSPFYLILFIPFLYFHFHKNKIEGIKYAPLGWKSPDKTIKLSIKLVNISEVLFWASLLIGLSSPYIILEKKDIEIPGYDMVIAMDLSASMQAADFYPNRLENMKSKVSEFIQDTEGANISLVVFSGKPYLHTPFTRDKESLIKGVNSLHFQTIAHQIAGGTQIGDAILFSLLQFEPLKDEHREKVLLLLTDGENTGGSDPILSARDSLQKGVHIYIVGIAGDSPIPVFYRGEPYIAADGKQLITTLDDSSLKKIADAGGGLYYRAGESNGLQKILTMINRLEKKPFIYKDLSEKLSLDWVFTFIALVAFLIYIFYAGIFVRRPLR